MSDSPPASHGTREPPKVSGAALRKLRSLGHALDPVVAVGKGGVTEAIVRAANEAIRTHELIKVKMQREAGDRHEAAIALAARTGSVLAQVLGRTALLYRRNPEKPKIVLPKEKDAGRAPAPSPKTRAPAVAHDDEDGGDDA